METVTEILVDISLSMKKKIDATKKVLLNDVLPNLDYSSRIGIKTFALINNQLLINPVLALSKTDKDAIKNSVESIICSNGGTPIAASIRASVKSLSEYPANEKMIILVTDGQETGKGDYVQEAKNATKEGINCKIHVVGIDLNYKAKNQAQEISKITEGTPSFISLANGTYNQTAVRKDLSTFHQAIKSTPTSVTAKPKVEVEKKKETTRVKPEGSTTQHSDKSSKEEIPSETLKHIVDQIAAIRQELTDLKNEKTEIPEVIEDAELNEKIRSASEEYLNKILTKKYPERVNWLNEKGESHSDHDFEILDLDGSIEYYIECKGTTKNKPTFYVTKNEWRLFLNHTKNYQIYFVQNSFNNPSYIFIDNLLDWLLKGKVVPYLKEKEVIKKDRVFLTIIDTVFDT